jgi:hypothetical protein
VALIASTIDTTSRKKMEQVPKPRRVMGVEACKKINSRARIRTRIDHVGFFARILVEGDASRSLDFETTDFVVCVESTDSCAGLIVMKNRISGIVTAVAMALTFAIVGGDAFAQQTTTKEKHIGHMDQMEMMQECAKACSDCQLACNRCAAHCAKRLAEGKKEYLACLKTCQDCAACCVACAEICARGGPLAAFMVECCAKCCDKCAEACEAFPNDPELKKCAEECRKCEKSCKEMTKHLSNK